MACETFVLCRPSTLDSCGKGYRKAVGFAGAELSPSSPPFGQKVKTYVPQKLTYTASDLSNS